MTAALAFEKWVEVQGKEEFPSVCIQMGFGNIWQLKTGIHVVRRLSTQG